MSEFEVLNDTSELDSLAADAPVIDEPTGATVEPAPEATPRETAEASAAMVSMLTEEIITKVWPVVTYTAEQRRTFQARLVPVLAKYDVMPPWLAVWREEIHLAMFLAMAGYGTWAQIEAHKAATDGSQPAPATA